MSQISKITEKDFTVVTTEAKYGPVWTISSLKNPREHYILRSTINMNEIEGRDFDPAVHLDVVHGTDPSSNRNWNWKGVYRTTSMQEAFVSLIDDLNRNVELEYIQNALWDVTSSLNEEISKLETATEAFTHLDIDAVMEDVDSAYTALKVRYAEAKARIESTDA